MAVSPNPTWGPLRIVTSDGLPHTIEITDMLGHTLDVQRYRRDLDLGWLPPGGYLLLLRDAQGQRLATTRIVRLG